jgi:hypothetical protein
MSLTRPYVLLNSLVNVYGLAPGGKRDTVDNFDRESKLLIEFTPEVAVYSARIFFSESIGGHDTQNSTTRRLLHELELPYMYERIIVHIQGSPRNLRAVGCDQHFLSPMTANLSNERMFPPAGFTTVSDVCGPIAGSVSDERHHAIDKACSYNLAPLARRIHGLAVLVEQFKVAVSRPDMIIVVVFTPGRKDNLFRLTVTGE